MFLKARVRTYTGIDAYDKTVEVTDEAAENMDGKISVDNTYPCNKLCTVRWYEKAPEKEPDEDIEV